MIDFRITGVPTIEGEMVKALLKSNLIEQAHADDVSKVGKEQLYSSGSCVDTGLLTGKAIYSCNENSIAN